MPILEAKSEETRVVVQYGERTHLLSTAVLGFVYKPVHESNTTDCLLIAKPAGIQLMLIMRLLRATHGARAGR